MTEKRKPYGGETYYGLSAVKPSHYGWLIVSYFFVGGLAAACQFIATIADWFGPQEDHKVVRAGRYLALAGALASPALLVADLQTPGRWYNMLRILRRSSPMSMGSWALALFGGGTGVAALGQVAEDLGAKAAGDMVGKLAGPPAAAAAGFVSLYTGTLVAATSTPIWAAAFPFASSLFTSSAVSTATAALSLAAEASGASKGTHRRLAILATIASAADLGFTLLIERQWHRRGVATPLQTGPMAVAYRAGAQGLGVAVPLVAHAAEAITGRHSRPVAVLAALSALAGGYTLRAVLILGGHKSAERPQDYFRLAQHEYLSELGPGEAAARGPVRQQTTSGGVPAGEMAGR
jgi:protein NrfD